MSGRKDRQAHGEHLLINWSINMTTKSLSVKKAKQVLSNAEIRRKDQKIEIFYNDEWLQLCRTDYMDDICTIDEEDPNKTLEELRQKYLRKIRYGAYTNNRFAVIDSVSDG